MIVYIPSELFRNENNANKFYEIMKNSECCLRFSAEETDLLEDALRERGEDDALEYYLKMFKRDLGKND